MTEIRFLSPAAKFIKKLKDKKLKMLYQEAVDSIREDHGQHARRRQHPRTAQEVARAMRPQRCDPLADPEEGHRQQKIIGDLGVVGADFE